MTELSQINRTLQIHLSTFVENCADCTDILGHLQTRNIISGPDQEAIQQSQQGRRAKNQALMLAIMKSTSNQDQFKDLCYVLDEDEQYKDFCDSLKTFYAILKCQEEITELIEIDQILPLLEESDKQCLHVIGDKTQKKIWFFDKILQTKLPYFQLKKFLPYLKQHPNRYSELLKKINSTIQGLEEHHHKYLSLPESLISFKYSLIGSYKKLTCMGANDWHANEANPQLDPTNFHFNFVAINSDDDEQQAAQLRLVQHDILFKSATPEEDSRLTVIYEDNIFLPDSEQTKIMIQGAPGSGKSSFVIKICKLWAENRLVQYDLVVRMRLNDPKIANAKSLSDLCSIYQEAEVTVIAEEMEKCAGKGILFILDGWDELDEAQQTNSIFTDILSTRLPHASVVVTSRPTSSLTLKEQYEFTCTFEIVRLTQPQVQKHLHYCLANNREQNFQEEVDRLFHSKEFLRTPLNLSSLVYLYIKEGHKLPSTLTETFTKLLLLIINRHLDNPLQDLESIPSDFCCLLQLAYESICTNRSVHSENDISRICYHSDEVPSNFHWFGLVLKEHDPLTRAPRAYQFSSNIVQDFLSAYYLTTQFDPAQQKDELKQISALSNSHEMFLVFYAGLTGLKDIDTSAVIPKLPIGRKISSMTGRFMYNLVAMIIMKNGGFKEYSRRSYSAQEYSNAVYDQISKEHLLVLMACCAEAQSQEACRAFCNSNLFLTNSCYADIPDHDTAVTGYLLSSLSYCILHSGKRWIIHCNSVPSDAVKHMTTQMTEPREGDGCVYILRTKAEPQQIDGLVSLLRSHLARHLQSLDLSHSSTFDPTCIENLIPVLQSMHLVVLDLINCNIEHESANHIATLLHTNTTLEYLALTENRLTIPDVLLITEALKHNNTLLVLAIDGALQRDRQLVDAWEEINVIREENRAPPLGYDITGTVRIPSALQRVFGLFPYNIM